MGRYPASGIAYSVLQPGNRLPQRILSLPMSWIQLTRSDQLDDNDRTSYDRPVLIYKHSPRCSLSNIAFQRIEGLVNELPTYFLDLIKHRGLSDEIEKRYKVYHESPQLLLIRDGECVYEASHMDIHADTIRDQVSTLPG